MAAGKSKDEHVENRRERKRLDEFISIRERENELLKSENGELKAATVKLERTNTDLLSRVVTLEKK